MTFTSERSGSASRGVFITAKTPPMTMNKVASRVRKGFLPDHSMIFASTASLDSVPAVGARAGTRCRAGRDRRTWRGARRWRRGDRRHDVLAGLPVDELERDPLPGLQT